MKIKIHVTKVHKSKTDGTLLIATEVKQIGGELTTARGAIVLICLTSRLNSLLDFYNYLEELRPMCGELEITGTIDKESWKDIVECFNGNYFLAERWAEVLVNVCHDKPLYA